MEAQATSTSRLRMTSRIERWCTSTSYIDFSSESGSMPCDIVRFACGSMSTHRTRKPFSENATARLSAVVVFATPPFWFANAMTLGFCSALSMSAPYSPVHGQSPSRAGMTSRARGRLGSAAAMLVHWDDVEGRTIDLGELRGTWRRLGRAAGAVGVGANRIDLPPGG